MGYETMVKKLVISLAALFLFTTTWADDDIVTGNGGDVVSIAQISVSAGVDVVAASFDCAMSENQGACGAEPAAYFSITDTQLMDTLLTARAQGKPITYWTFPNKPFLTLFASDSSPGVRGGQIMAVEIVGDPTSVAASNSCKSWQLQFPTFICDLSGKSIASSSYEGPGVEITHP